MFHLTACIEDTTILASARKRDPNGPNGPELVDVLVADNLTGKQQCATWTFNQLTAVLALAMGMGEENLIGEDGTENLYAITRPLFEGWEPSVVPTP